MNRILLMLALAGCSSTPTGTMRQPVDYSYDVRDRTYEGRVTVTRCEIANQEVTVWWEVTNLSKLSNKFSHDNKVLVDRAGRMFHIPSSLPSTMLAPTETADFVTAYTLPAAVDTKNLSWGLRNTADENLRYKIELECGR